MDVEKFAIEYDIVQFGNRDDIIFNIKELGEMLRNHTLNEISEIIEEMCNVG